MSSSKEEKENNINNTNHSMTMKDIDVTQAYSEVELNKNYVIEKFGGIPRTILSTVISSIYSLTFIILLLIFNPKTGDEVNKKDCKPLKRWNRALYIVLIISLIFAIICTIIQIKNRHIEKNVTLILLIRTLFNYIVGLTMLICMTVVYFTHNGSECTPVGRVDLVYIILEWIIFTVCIVFHYSIVIYFCCCKAKRKYWDGEGEIDPEEIKKVI